VRVFPFPGCPDSCSARLTCLFWWSRWQARRAQLGLTLLKLREHVCEAAGVLEAAEPTATASPKRPVLTHGKPVMSSLTVSPARDALGDPVGP
jgi:hypothetical protein